MPVHQSHVCAPMSTTPSFTPPSRPNRVPSRRRGLGWSALLVVIAVAGSAAEARAQGRVYVASGSTVLGIDTATNAVATATPVVSSPARLEASRDGARVFASHTAAGLVSIIDTATNVATTMTVGPSPSALALSPDGATLYVSTSGASNGAVQVVDVASRTVVATVDTPASGTGGDLAVKGDGSLIYYAAGAVSVIDTASGQVVRTFGAATFQIEVAPDGSRAYVSATTGLAAGALQIYDLTSATPTIVGGIGATVGELAMTPDGSRVYASHQGELVFIYDVGAFFPGRTVFVVDSATAAVVANIDMGASSSNWSDQHTPHALSVSPDRRSLYVSVPRLGGLAVADVNTNLVTSLTTVASPGALSAGGTAALVPYVVNAVDDVATYSNFGGVAIPSVLANDTYGGIRATLAHVTLTQVSADAGLSLDTSTGAVAVAAGAATGVRAVVYEICERGTPGNCDTATATVTVRDNSVIDALDDAATTLPARYALSNVLANDTLNGATATTALVTLTQVSSSVSTISLVPSNGGVFVYAGTPAGVHTLTYRICEKATPGNCDQATVTITVQAFPIDAVDDIGSATRAGGTAIANVLANDRFNGAVATTSSVTITQVTAPVPGVTLNTTTGAVTVAAGAAKGTYAIGYSICEKNSPTNCDQATATVTVTAYTIVAAADYGRGSSKSPNSPIANVLANDSLGGAPATVANVALSFVSLTPANSKIRLDVSDGSVDVLTKTDSLIYTLVYRICERAEPANCAQGTATVELTGK